MALGPGKYDDLCTYVRERTGGSVLLMVLGGNQGEGFACQADFAALLALPDLLEHVAGQIRRDMNQGKA